MTNYNDISLKGLTLKKPAKLTQASHIPLELKFIYVLVVMVGCPFQIDEDSIEDLGDQKR